MLSAETLFDTFIPLPSSAPANSLPASSPLQLSSPNFLQTSIASRTDSGVVGSNWDMITANETGSDAGRYLFSPFETSIAGVMRYDRVTGTVTTIVNPGTQAFVSGDASRWTPWGGYLTAEESWDTTSTKGRLFEVTNPTTAGAGGANFVQRNIIPRVSHEGLAFDKDNNMYFIDELNGGSIYRYTSANPNATNGDDYFAAGKTSVLRVGTGFVFGATGAATWVDLTDANGAALAGAVLTASTTDPAGTIDGRATADVAAFKGTEYNRPEDMEIQTLSNGTQKLYFTTTDTHEVFSLDLASMNVSLFASRATIDALTGLAVGNVFANPDNLAIDAEGNIYIVEDQPGGSADIWFATDADRNGVAESIGRWASLTSGGAEPTGLYFDKFDPNIAYVNVQHPSDNNDPMIQINAVPEPPSGLIMLAGLGGLLGLACLRNRRAC
jgi:secreted PhoX family phosphatase